MELIRKISIGPDILNAMHFSVGQKLLKGTHTVDNIVRTDDMKIQIWVQNDEDEVYLWKEINQHTPVTIEYNIEY